MKLVKFSSSFKRVETSHRKFRQFNLNYIDNPELVSQQYNILFENITDALVKVNIICREEQLANIKIRKITEYIKSFAFYLKPIVPVIIRENVVYKDIGLSINPIEAVNEFLSSEKFLNKEIILKEAISIIAEVNTWN